MLSLSCRHAAGPLLLLLMWSQLVVPAPAGGQGGIAALQASLVEVIERIEPSVVAIRRAPPRPEQADQPLNRPRFLADELFNRPTLALNQERFQPTGAGVVIDSRGLILTQYLNIRPDDQHTVTTTAGRTYPAIIKGADPRSGLAVLEIQAEQGGTVNLPALELGDADQLRKGHLVLTAGNAEAILADGQPSVSCGIVSNLAQRASSAINLNNVPTPSSESNFQTTLHHLGTLIQTDARLGWGSGGGALVNLEGKLVGITTTVTTIAGHEQAAGYALPINATFRRVIDTLQEGREVEYGLLGVNLTPVDQPPFMRPTSSTAQQPTSGAVVGGVLPGTAAAQAGLQAGDVVQEINGQPIVDPTDLQLFIGGFPPNQTVRLGVWRGGEALKLPVTLSKYYVPGPKVITQAPPKWRGLQVDYGTALPIQRLMTAAQNGELDPAGCVVVTEVVEGSVAWQAGVRPGMFITHVGDTRVNSPEAFQQAVQSAAANVTLRFSGEAFPHQNGNRPPAERQLPQEI